MTMECSDEPNEYCDNREKERNPDKDQEKKVTKVEYKEELADVSIKTKHKCQDSGEKLLIRKAMLEHLSTNNNVFFRQLKDEEEELSREQKIDMAEELLDRSYGLFLAKYGNHLLKEHLCYFETTSEEDAFIVEMYLKQLNKVLEKQSRQQMKPRLARTKNKGVISQGLTVKTTSSFKSRAQTEPVTVEGTSVG
ncbi:hypothetical protein J6590_010724 [Homalodisca vitripennis]|nr:hypothetical protein J6590_010724 [Homalodisca vitripennis]